MPMYVLVIIATVLAVIIFPNAINTTNISLSGFARSVLFIPYIENNGHPSILPQAWSLYYEIFFYVAMFLCILFVKNKKYLTIFCAFILVLVITAMNYMHIENSILNFYCGELSFEFIGGIMLYHLHCRFSKNKILIQTKTKIILFFLSIVSYGFLIFSEMYEFYLFSYRSVNWGIPAFILVSSLLFLEENIQRTKILKFVALELGDASYIMYLIHFHIQVFFVRIVFNKFLFNGGFAIEAIKFLITSAIVVIISVALHKFIDKPIQKYFIKKIT